MASTLCKLVVLARIGGGVSQDIRLNPADPESDVVQVVDTDLVPLFLLPRKVRVEHAVAKPNEAECRAGVVDLVQNVGGGLYDLAPTAAIVGHVFVGGVWVAGYGYGFQLIENSATKTKNLRAKNTTGVATQIIQDYIVQVSF